MASKEAIKESEIDTTMTPSEIEKEVENEANRRKGSATSEILPSANFSSTAVSSSPSSMLSSFHAGINDNLGLALQVIKAFSFVSLMYNFLTFFLHCIQFFRSWFEFVRNFM